MAGALDLPFCGAVALSVACAAIQAPHPTRAAPAHYNGRLLSPLRPSAPIRSQCFDGALVPGEACHRVQQHPGLHPGRDGPAGGQLRLE